MCSVLRVTEPSSLLWLVSFNLLLALKVLQSRLVEAWMLVRLFQGLRVSFKGENRGASQRCVVEDRHELVLRQNAPDLIVLDQHDIERVLVDVEGLTNELLKVVDLLVTLDGETVENAALGGVEWNPEELFLD